MALNKAKYENAILYLTRRLGGEVHGKKKLAKLLYFLDFDFFEKNERSVTGDEYKALPMGPFPSAMDGITAGLAGSGKLTIEKRSEYSGYEPTEVYGAKVEPDIAVFDPEEVAMLDRVILKYGNLNGKQLQDLTHAEAPYIGTEPNQVIFYELAAYRGTDFSQPA